MKMKKLIALLLALGILLAFAGCVGGGNKQTEATEMPVISENAGETIRTDPQATQQTLTAEPAE